MQNELSSRNPVESPAPRGDWQARPLVLVGLMGAGKSTIGRRLAKQIGWRFVDSDEEIEAAAGCSIADIFTIHGESIFRDLEKRVIGRLLGEAPMVLATGGGAWMQEGVRAIIKEKATSVWLRAELEVLTDRVSKRNHRPLLETGDKREILERLMRERYPVYGLADVIVDSSVGPHELVVDRVVAALEQMGQKA
ncbi:MAG: shikimate kinase [Rickettsiales bacterium]